MRSRPSRAASRLIEDAMQSAAMDHHFGELIARKLAALLLVDELAKAVEEAALAALDSRREHSSATTERGELAHRMGQQRDADAELLDLRCAFVDAIRDAAPMQVEREREPADPAPTIATSVCGIVQALRRFFRLILRRPQARLEGRGGPYCCTWFETALRASSP